MIGAAESLEVELEWMTITSSELASIRALVEQRHGEFVKAARRLVEIESPSGDIEGSRAINQMLEVAAHAIPSVYSVERIFSPGCGEHLLIRAFEDKLN